MRFHSYLNSAIQILNEYKGKDPFTGFLKKFFNYHKKYGSKDRKQISHLCYCYFRLGRSLLEIPVEERILTGLFLCSNEPNEMLEKLKPEWNKRIGLSAREKLFTINYSLLMKDVFPWKDELSEEISYEKFCESFLVQPDLFLRLRPGYENRVKAKLLNERINFKEITATCLSLSNASKIENIIELDREAVIQDHSSQRTGKIFQTAINDLPSVIHTWDCCAASGGKSLLLHDIHPNIDLAVSDIRASILINLKKRFAKAGIKNYKSFVVDLTKPEPNLKISKFEFIICDAPCTGSGTWGRTPEQLYFFDEKKIAQYAGLQKKIVSNVIPYLNEKAFFIYSTCSVFKNENEEIVNYIREEFNLGLIKMELLKGYHKKADTMFVSIFRKSS